MRTTSSLLLVAPGLMSLLTSTAGMGSTKSDAPEPEEPWTMPGIEPAMLGLEEQDVAVVAGGDELVLQHAVRVLALQVRLHDGLELRFQPRQRAADLGQAGRGVVRHLARRAGSRGGWRTRRRMRRLTPAARRASSGAPSARATRRPISIAPSMKEATSLQGQRLQEQSLARALACRAGATSGRSW